MPPWEREGVLTGPPVAREQSGFTLIEVIAALVIFSIAVLFTTGLTTALAVQMRSAALRSDMVAAAQQRLDSISIVAYDALPVGTTIDTLQMQGRIYLSTMEVIQFQPRIREIRIQLAPAEMPGPEYTVHSYVVEPW